MIESKTKVRHYEFKKLVRDNLPSRMEQEKIIVHGKKIQGEKLLKELKNKMIEEANEVREAKDVTSLKIELADVLEVIYAIACASNIDMQNIEDERLKKRKINGGFHGGNYIDHIEVSEDNKEIIDYLNDKNRPYKFRTKNETK